MPKRNEQETIRVRRLARSEQLAAQKARNLAAAAETQAAREAAAAFAALSPEEQRNELRARHQANLAAQRERNAEVSGETKAAPGPAENKMLPAQKAAPENKANALEGVAFASPAAHARAAELGLTADSFKRRRKSSERGYTLADVERVADESA